MLLHGVAFSHGVGDTTGDPNSDGNRYTVGHGDAECESNAIGHPGQSIEYLDPAAS